jgi:hypothetical protein
MATCPKCQSPGTVTVRLVLAAKPAGTYSLAGVQTKATATVAAVAECPCGLSVPGHLENPTYAADGRSFTGGHFVADQ